MPFEFGDVVLAPFPFTNQADFKQRPAVVVSSRAYNSTRPDVIIMPITSQLSSVSGLGEVLIGEWRQANLLKPSAIKPVFATLEQRLIIRSLGVLQAQDQSALRTAIASVLG
jgi:mRNA interferase MazF